MALNDYFSTAYGFSTGEPPGIVCTLSAYPATVGFHLREKESNLHTQGYGPCELPLFYPAENSGFYPGKVITEDNHR